MLLSSTGPELLRPETTLLHLGLEISCPGGARIWPRDGGLVVSNIGSSGEDGVRVIVPPSDSSVKDLRIPFDGIPLDFTSQPPLGGDLAGVKLAHFASNGDPLGTAELGLVEGAGELGVPLRADFTDLGTDQVHVQVCIDGDCVGEYVAGAGELSRIRYASVADTRLSFAGASATADVPGGTRSPGYGFGFDRSVEVIPPGAAAGGGIVGREVFVSALQSLVTVQSLYRMELTARRLEGFTVTGTVRDSFGNFLVEHYTGPEIQQLIDADFDLDTDHDGTNAIQEFTRGTPPTRWDSGEYSPRSTVRTGPDGLPRLRWSYVLAPVSGVEVRMRSSEDLGTFDEDPGQWSLVGRQPLPGGRIRLAWEMKEPVGGVNGEKRHKYHGHVTVLK
jgi:hypothetical protein